MKTNEQGEPYLEGQAIQQWRRPFNGLCWVCGSTELSSEHKFKRSDLRSMGTGKLLWTDGHTWQELRSTNDKRARFRVNNLCKHCNNELSQPADRAWQQFSAFVNARWRQLGSAVALNLVSIYGAQHAADGSALLRQYVVRHLGCRISEAGFAVPDDLRSYVNGAPPPPTVAICLFYSHVRASMVGTSRDNNTLSHLSIGPMLGELSKSRGRATTFYTELCIGPVGALIKWSDSEPVGRSFGTWAKLHPRATLPYPELHEPWPSYSALEPG